MEYEKKEKIELILYLSKVLLDEATEQIDHLKKTNQTSKKFNLIHKDEFRKKLKIILDEFLILYRN